MTNGTHATIEEYNAKFLFDKMLTSSDAGGHGRVVIPKVHAAPTSLHVLSKRDHQLQAGSCMHVRRLRSVCIALLFPNQNRLGLVGLHSSWCACMFRYRNAQHVCSI